MWYDLDYRNCAICGVKFMPIRYRQRTHSIPCQIVYDGNKRKAYSHKKYLETKRKNAYLEQVIAVNQTQDNSLVV